MNYRRPGQVVLSIQLYWVHPVVQTKTPNLQNQTCFYMSLLGNFRNPHSLSLSAEVRETDHTLDSKESESEESNINRTGDIRPHHFVVYMFHFKN